MKPELSKKINRSISFILFLVILMTSVFSQGVLPVHAQDETPGAGEETTVTVTPIVTEEETTETATPLPEEQVPTATPTPEDLPTEEVTPTTEVTAEPTVETTTAPVCYPLTLQATEGQGNLIATTPQNCEGGYIEGTTVTITANLLEGYVVSGWQGTIDDASTALLNMWIASSNGVVTLLTKEGDATDQIIGGVEVSPQGKYPWIVALVHAGAATNWNGQFCGGSIIASDTVVTAAHCVVEETTSSFVVVAGVHDLWAGTGYQTRTISRVYVHPKYNATSYDNDIAIIKLANPFSLGGTGSTAVGTISIISSATLPTSNAIVAGWGATGYPVTSSSQYPDALREVSLPIISNSICNNASHYNGSITANMICAGYDAGGYDSCYGDSGGPLFFNDGGYVLAGIVSWGYGCAINYRPGVYTRIYNYLPWIASFSTNDDFDYATTISAVPSKTTQNTSGAFLGTDDPALTACGLSNGDASVWYKYTASANRSITFDTLGSNYDTQMGVFTGSRGSLTSVGCNDNAVAGVVQSRVTINATSGTVYYIVISQRYANNPGGSMVLHAASFNDVDASAWYWPYIEGFYAQGITKGCGASYPLVYCPDRSVTRAEMAVFLLRAKYSGTYVPPTGTGIFSDMPVTGKEWMQDWVEKFYADGITTGCANSPLAYCPEREVTRAEMAVFILRAKHGASYVPPTATGVFTDVPVTGKEWMQDWIEQFYNEGITTGCGTSPMRYCPEQKVTRMEMAVFLSRAFSFPQLP